MKKAFVCILGFLMLLGTSELTAAEQIRPQT